MKKEVYRVTAAFVLSLSFASATAHAQLGAFTAAGFGGAGWRAVGGIVGGGCNAGGFPGAGLPGEIIQTGKCFGTARGAGRRGPWRCEMIAS